MGQKRDIDGQGIINQLPDQILISILSLLTMKEAAQTSVISRRWEKLWTFHPRLEFDGSQTLIPSPVKDLDFERARYVNWVNHIVESCRLSAHVIDEFKVYFDLDESYKGDIDEWVRFAIEKKVKIFELSFYDSTGFRPTYDRLYPLCIQNLCLPSFISLTSLVLKHVSVSDKVIANFLSNSPFLEYLCVGRLMSLAHLRVVGPSLRLKYLEIIRCSCMKSLEVDAANLLSLKFTGQMIKIHSINAPNLVELLIGDAGCIKYLTRVILGMSQVYSQLQKLSFHMIYVEKWMKKHEYPVFSQLKELTLQLFACDHESLLFFSSLINACPSLTRFTLELKWREGRAKRAMQRARLMPHHSLKVVEIVGFVGQTVDTEFCMYLIENAIMLEKIIINPRSPELVWMPKTHKVKIGEERVKAARECAEQLKSKYFLGEKLVFCHFDN